MSRCIFLGIMLITLLASFCLWNCYHREDLPEDFVWQGCRDQDGRPIDSFILYKLPRDPSSSYHLIQQGLGYMYLAPDTSTSFRKSGGISSILSYSSETVAGWILSNRSIAHPHSMPGYTLGSLYTDPAVMMMNALVIMYNDEFPNGTTSESHGHTKGVVVMTEHGGYWLVHSTPRYPPSPPQASLPHMQDTDTSSDHANPGGKEQSDGVVQKSTGGSMTKNWFPWNTVDWAPYHFRTPKSKTNNSLPGYGSETYDYPATGTRYGQTFMCISLPNKEADNLGLQLLQNRPYMYVSYVAPKLRGRYLVLESVIAGLKPPANTNYRVTQLSTMNGNTVTSFAKYTTYGKDLYSGLVAPTLKSNLLVESWRNGVHPLPSACNSSDEYTVENIEKLKAGASKTCFSTHHDHSKWAVARESSKPYVCIGDINRMSSQAHRAGGTVCVWSPTIWRRFFNLILSVESCPEREALSSWGDDAKSTLLVKTVGQYSSLAQRMKDLNTHRCYEPPSTTTRRPTMLNIPP